MLWLTIGVALLLALLAFGFVVWPLWRTGAPLRIDDDNPLTDLLTRKDSVLLSIKELEFDYQTGKLSAEDFEQLNGRLRQRAISLLRQIEKTAPASADLEAELEALILQQRKLAGVPKLTLKESGADKRRFCPECGGQVKLTDKFCAQCGTALHTASQQVVPASAEG